MFCIIATLVCELRCKLPPKANRKIKDKIIDENKNLQKWYNIIFDPFYTPCICSMKKCTPCFHLILIIVQPNFDDPHQILKG